MDMNETTLLLATLRSRSDAVLVTAEDMVSAKTLEDFDRAYQKLCGLLEPIGEKLDLVPMETLGYSQTGPDTWRRQS